MALELVDYSFSPPTASSLVAAGKHGAGRYVGAGTAGKKLTASERDALFRAGLCVWLSVEGQANDALQGHDLGARHGAMAVRDSQWLGAPKGVALFGNVDFDVIAAQWPACRAYMAGFAGAVRPAGYRVGLYGGYNAIAWGARDKVADVFWQTYAWSGGRWHPAAQLQQYRNGVPMGGGDVDLCRAVAADFGQWAPGGHHHPEGDDMLVVIKNTDDGAYYSSNYVWRHHLSSMGDVNAVLAAMGKGPANKDVTMVTTAQLGAYGADTANTGGSGDHVHDLIGGATGPAHAEP